MNLQLQIDWFESEQGVRSLSVTQVQLWKHPTVQNIQATPMIWFQTAMEVNHGRPRSNPILEARGLILSWLLRVKQGNHFRVSPNVHVAIVGESAANMSLTSSEGVRFQTLM